MADKQLSYNCWFSFQQYVYMSSNAKKKYKSWLNISKKHLGRGNFVLNICKSVSLFQRSSCCFSRFLIYIIYNSDSFSYYFHFLIFESKLNVKFCHKKFLLLSSFPIITGYGTEQILLMKVEILGHMVRIPTAFLSLPNFHSCFY